MLFPLDGPAVYKSITVTDTPQEVKVNAVVLDERKIITLQPLGGTVYYGYDNTVSASTGTKVFKGQWLHLEASSSLPVWVVAAPGDSVDTRITEVS